MLSRREPTVRFAHWNHGLNGFAFGARLGADETCVVGRRYNKSLDRSAFSRLVIRKPRMPGSSSPRPVNSTIVFPVTQVKATLLTPALHVLGVGGPIAGDQPRRVLRAC